VPNVGKSTLINQIVVNMAKIHKWPAVVFSGEKAVKPFLALEFQTAYVGKAKADWSMEERQRSLAFVERYFSFIDHDPRLDDEDIDLDYLLDRAATAVFRYGAKLLLIDPWNELEHKVGGNTSLTQYTGDAIRKLKRFGRSFDCAVVVVAHPTKLSGGEIPGLYSISDSANWANKADLGLIVHADDPTDTKRTIRIAKVRLKGLAGQVGDIELGFDQKSYLFKAPDF
jgi:twinkle protein